MNGAPSTRYHAEVKLSYDAREVRVNIFADTLVEIYRDLANICQQLPGPIQNGGHREIANAEGIANQIGTDANKKPACRTCKSDKEMELVEFTDKETGEVKKAWKCQHCKKWWWPPKQA